MRDKRTSSASPSPNGRQGMSPAERTLRARVAAYVMHSRNDARQTSAKGRAGLDDAGQALSLFELDEIEHQERLAGGQPLCAGGQPPGTAPSPMVEPVVAVGGHLELAQPTEHGRRRRRDRDRAGQPANGGGSR